MPDRVEVRFLIRAIWLRRWRKWQLMGFHLRWSWQIFGTIIRHNTGLCLFSLFQIVDDSHLVNPRKLCIIPLPPTALLWSSIPVDLHFTDGHGLHDYFEIPTISTTCSIGDISVLIYELLSRYPPWFTLWVWVTKNRC